MTADSAHAWLVAQVQADLDGARVVEIPDDWSSQRWFADVDAEFIETWSPARVIAECEAKLERLERHRPREYALSDGYYCGVCQRGPWPCAEVLSDAAVYADRDGFPEELKKFHTSM